MSWATDSGDHEGWAAHYFADGEVSSGWEAGGPIVAYAYPALPLEVARAQAPDDLGDVVRPESDALGAIAVCACGWRGSRRPGQDPEDMETLDDLASEWRHHVEFWEQP
ncbi:MAG: hypothetical protein MUF60_09510 [Vicinamibacterales bacterium]|jgi:hypothetical protein|nr:hypothetical protein [Vicinamibacterales bacterium]